MFPKIYGLAVLTIALSASTHAVGQRATANPSQLQYAKPMKPVDIAENNDALQPSNLKGAARRLTTQTPSRVPVARARKKEEMKFFMENITALSPLIVGGFKLDPSASADYCTTPAVMQGCCGYGIRNNQTNKDEFYGSPMGVFKDETEARNYYLSLDPELPFYQPYADPKVNPGGGWYYSNGNGHGSVDYGKTGDGYGPGIDPTFNVLAAADGTVIGTDWVDLFGNYVIIEHKAPDGSTYRTGYFHLRDGFDHDLAKARSTVVTSGKADERDSLYKVWSNKTNQSQLLWGTNAQTIKVKTGDKVTAGQQIAFAGNTGYGGAGWGIKPDGSLWDVNTANNHLHYMLWIKAPANSTGTNWLEIDPYGLYSKIDDATRACLQPGANKAFSRFFAAHYPSFHGIPLEVALADPMYFPAMGMNPQSFSVSRKNNSFIASGTYQYQASKEWACRVNMSSDSYQKYFTQYLGQGMVPRQISVTKDNSGQPLFTAIWRKLQPNEKVEGVHNQDEAAFSTAFAQQTTTKKLACVEHVRYEINGKPYHIAIYSSINPGGYVYSRMSATEMQQRFNELSGKGFMPTNITAEEVGGSLTFGGVWVPSKGKQYVALADLSATAYQERFEEMAKKGFTLQRVSAYANSEKFIGIWTK